MVLDMDKDAIKFPKEFLREAGRRNLHGLPLSQRSGAAGAWTGSARAWSWKRSAPSAMNWPASSASARNWSATPSSSMERMNRKNGTSGRFCGEILFAAECLTEPRGGSDFFGATSKAEDRGDHFLLNGQKRFIVGGEGADYFLVYARTNFDPGRQTPGIDHGVYRRSRPGRGYEIPLQPHGLPRRRDGPPCFQ